MLKTAVSRYFFIKHITNLCARECSDFPLSA